MKNLKNHNYMLSFELDSIKKTDWSVLLQQFDDATIYHTWSCGEVLWGKDKLSHVLCREGDEVVGLAQIATIKVPFIRGGTALVFWGPLWHRCKRKRDTQVFSNLIGFLREEFVEKRGMFLRVIPNEPKTNETRVRPVLEKSGFQFKGRFYRTYILDISSSPDELKKNFSQKWRNCLNQAERENLTMMHGTSLEFYLPFYEIFREMRKRRQITDISIDPEQLLKIQADLPADQKMQIFLCNKGHTPVAGAVISSIGNTAILLLAASNQEGREIKASYLMQWRMIEWLKKDGVRYYDLGGISPLTPGVNHFKAGLGGNDYFHVGLFEQCSNPVSLLFDRSMGIMKDFRKRLKSRMG